MTISAGWGIIVTIFFFLIWPWQKGISDRGILKMTRPKEFHCERPKAYELAHDHSLQESACK